MSFCCVRVHVCDTDLSACTTTMEHDKAEPRSCRLDMNPKQWKQRTLFDLLMG